MTDLQNKALSHTQNPSNPLLEPTVVSDNISLTGDLHELRPGQIIAGAVIERLLGRGGMGSVYLGRHQKLDSPVAVKVIPGALARMQPEFGARFMREGQLSAKLKHPHVVSPTDLGYDQASDCYYLVLEFMAGGSLRELVEPGPISEPQALRYIKQVAQALAFAESQAIIHRDIKPDNILLDAHDCAKLADLGLAKSSVDDSGGLTKTHAILGTPAYMSPEQIQDAKRVDHRSDLYSLGATLFHLLTGNAPFGRNLSAINLINKVLNEEAPKASDWNPEVSQASSQLCTDLLKKDPEQRPQTAKALIERIEIIERGEAKPAPEVEPWPWQRVLGPAMVLILIGALLPFFGREQPKPPAKTQDPKIIEPGEKPTAPSTPPSSKPSPVPKSTAITLALSLAKADDQAPLANKRGSQSWSVEDAKWLPRGERQVLDLAGAALPVVDFENPRAAAFWFYTRSTQTQTFFDVGQPERRMRGLNVGLYQRGDFSTWNHVERHGLYVGFWSLDGLIPLPERPVKAWHHMIVSVTDDNHLLLMLDGQRPDLGWSGEDPFELQRQPVPIPEGYQVVRGRLKLGGSNGLDNHPTLRNMDGALDDLVFWSTPLNSEDMSKVWSLVKDGQSLTERVPAEPSAK